MIDRNQIPASWEVVKLGEVCEKVSLNKIKIKEKEYLTAGRFPVVDQGQKLIGGYFDDENLVVPGEPPFVVFGDHTKVKKFISFRFIAGADGVKVLKPCSIYDAKFFYYLIHIVKIPDKGYARHFQFLEKEDIPLPPLPEQQAIVSKIEELLSDLENGKQQLQTAQQQLRVYRQSLLKWAFEGKLTNKKVKDGALPKGWKWVKLGDSTINFDGKRIPLSKNVRSKRKGDYRYYGATEIVDYIDDYIFEGTFLLIGEDGANLVTKSRPLAFIAEGKFWVNNHAHVLQTKSDLALKFLCYYFNSLNLSQFVTGSAQPKLTQANLNKILIPLPSFKEQQLIVDELESKLTVCDKIEETVSHSLQQAETLRQSILKKAFEGKLVEQNPKDELAAKLLERIKAESTKNEVEKKKSRRDVIIIEE